MAPANHRTSSEQRTNHKELPGETPETSRAPQRAQPPMPFGIVNNREFRQRIQQIVQRQQREVDEASNRKPPAAETAKPAITSRGHSARAGDNTMIPSSSVFTWIEYSPTTLWATVDSSLVAKWR